MRPLLTACILVLACDGPNQASASGAIAAPPNHELSKAIAQSGELEAAQEEIDRGHPWRATQALAPMLKVPAKRTPAALIVAARAAAGWGGWPEVDKLLAKERWIDARFAGEARELLTRSAFEQNADTVALTHARAAVHDAKDKDVRAMRLVYLARALERNNLFDSAAVAYGNASESLRSVRDWLQLRAAGSESDSVTRARTFARLTLAPAKSRVTITEAQTRERFSDALGAAARFAALGAPVNALRLRLSVAADSGTRGAIKNELLTFIRTRNGTPDAKTAVEVIDKAFTTNSPSDELIIARSSAISGPPARAVTAFARALTQPSLLTANDRLLYALSLARVNRSRDALAQLAGIEGPLAGSAAYQRARILMSTGTPDATRAALRDVITRFGNDTVSAASSLFLLADLSTDDANDTQARTLYQQLYHAYPSSARAADARFNSAIIAYTLGDARAAANELDSLFTLFPRSNDAAAAKYWSGRAWAAVGDTTLAATRWRDALAQQPVSYYAAASAKRLGVKSWTPPPRADSFLRFAAIDSGIARAALLERLGMDTEARFEYDALDEAASASPDRLIATAHAFLEHNQSSRAIRLAQKAIDAGQRDARAYRMLFPVVDRDELVRDAKSNGLDPALVAGLIRQESNFNARAVSIAGARGLMQVLPAVGEEVSRTLRYPVWYPQLLFEADANLQLGTAHLAAFTKRYGPVPRVLAAYNAGGSRVSRWVNRAGMDDPELFAERIPFAETRDYVRLVQRNAGMYATLYDW
jgi:soluble lytic murein transglycosylase